MSGNIPAKRLCCFVLHNGLYVTQAHKTTCDSTSPEFPFAGEAGSSFDRRASEFFSDDVNKSIQSTHAKTKSGQVPYEYIQLRLNGIAALRYFKSDDNASLLKSLLHDDSYISLDNNDGSVVKRFEVRAKAYEVLSAWEVSVPLPILETLR